MAHYAFLNSANIVTEVIVGRDEDSALPEGKSSWEEVYGDIRGQACKRTSYNTRGNKYYNLTEDNGHELAPDEQQSNAFRGNYAAPGDTYDTVNDVFYRPRPVVDGKTFTLNETTWLWEEVE